MTDEVNHCGGTVEKFAGDAVMAAFGAVSQMRIKAEDDVEANLATPCPGNVGSLLVAAVGMVHVGDQDAAARLAAKAESIGMIGYGRAHTAKWLRLAVARQDRTEIRRLVETVDRAWLTPASWELWAALLDALAVLDDSERIEADAPPLVRPDSYVAPFAIRALGIVRNDAAMLSDAVARFEALGLDWHAQQTRTLIER